MIYQFNKDNFDRAIFDSDQRDTVSVFYFDVKGILQTHSMDVNSKDKAFQHLLTLTTMEQIEEDTLEYIKALHDEQIEIVKTLAENGAIKLQDNPSVEAPTSEEILSALLATPEQVEEDAEGQEDLFGMKLYVFDLPEVLEASVELKEQIRLAKCPLEVFVAVSKCRESYNGGASDQDDTDPV